MSTYRIRVTLPSGDTFQVETNDEKDARAIHRGFQAAEMPVTVSTFGYEELSW